MGGVGGEVQYKEGRGGDSRCRGLQWCWLIPVVGSGEASINNDTISLKFYDNNCYIFMIIIVKFYDNHC